MLSQQIREHCQGDLMVGNAIGAVLEGLPQPLNFFLPHLRKPADLGFGILKHSAIQGTMSFVVQWIHLARICLRPTSVDSSRRIHIFRAPNVEQIINPNSSSNFSYKMYRPFPAML